MRKQPRALFVSLANCSVCGYRRTSRKHSPACGKIKQARFKAENERSQRAAEGQPK